MLAVEITENECTHREKTVVGARHGHQLLHVELRSNPILYHEVDQLFLERKLDEMIINTGNRTRRGRDLQRRRSRDNFRGDHPQRIWREHAQSAVCGRDPALSPVHRGSRFDQEYQPDRVPNPGRHHRQGSPTRATIERCRCGSSGKCHKPTST